VDWRCSEEDAQGDIKELLAANRSQQREHIVKEYFQRKTTMKKLIMICALVIFAAAFASTAKAVPVNPAEWNFVVITYGTDACWESGTNVDTGYPQYEYDWQIIQMNLKVEDLGCRSIIDDVPGDKSGGDTANAIPFEMLDQRFGLPGMFGMDINIYVDAGGFGHICADEINLGSYDGHAVEGIGLTGNITVNGIPEPTTIALLGLGGLVLVCRRRSACAA
jgi:hypothetical protein